MIAFVIRTAALAGGAFGVLALAAAAQPAPADGGPALRASSRVGQALFQQNCASCHQDAPLDKTGIQAPALTILRQFTPEKILDALNTGKMAPMAAALTPVQRQQIAEWVTGTPVGAAEQGDLAHVGNRCASRTPLSFRKGAGEWRGWGPSSTNARLQSAEAAGLTAGDVPKLKVKWAFAAPTAIEMYSQPTVAGGRIFLSSDTAWVYSLDAKSGCVHWAYRAASGVRNAPVFGAIPGARGKYGVFFGDRSNNVYGLDAESGALLWKRNVEDHPRAQITATPALFEGRLFVGVSSAETIPAGSPTYPCCTSRGSVVAIDVATGRQAWKTYTIAEAPQRRGSNANGLPLWGPAGASVWNSPTVDVKRRRLYVGTGNAYTLPAPSTSDAILALDVDTGRIVWSHQEFAADAFIGGCGKTAEPGGNCPVKLGPDWDFGGASMILAKGPNGRDLVVGAGKGGVAVAVDPDRQGAVVWRTVLYKGDPPGASGLVVFGGAADRDTLYYPLQQKDGGLAAVNIADGRLKWTAALNAGPRGQAAAATAIPGLVFTGAWDGTLRAVSTDDGRLVWSFDTKTVFPTVNGYPGRGGSLGAPGVVVADGMAYVVSGYVGPGGGAPGNVLLAMAPG